MYLLDTDHLSIAIEDTIEGFTLGMRLELIPAKDLAVTIITYEEQMRGWLSYVAQSKTIDQQVNAYDKLRSHIERFRSIPIVDFDRRAALEFERLRKAKIRTGTMDLKIAAIAFVNNATLLTRNYVDFAKVPYLKFEDWTV